MEVKVIQELKIYQKMKILEITKYSNNSYNFKFHTNISTIY